jgi:phage terminase large subunit
MEIRFKPTIKQFEAWEYLNDNTTTELLFGGAAGSSKTYFGCCFLIISCLRYPKTRWLMGRAKLNTLKNTTLKTFKDIVSDWGLFDMVNINYQNNTIVFDNGSEIVMKDLFSYPSDPDFDSLGSLEITGAFIDEISQISYKAYEVVNTRIRYKLKQNGLIPKCLSSCNPSKGWLYNEFYKPFKEGNLKPYRKFIPALASDNPYIDPSYIEQLKKSSHAIQQRLLYGMWDYSDDIDSLFKYSHLIRMRDNINSIGGKRYISADIARLGKDKTIIMIWEGLTVIEIIEMEQVTTDISAQKIIELSGKYNIDYDNIIIDSDGVGGGVVDQMPGVIPFINNSRPISNGEPNNYQNLKSQCYYKLAESVENELIKIKDINNEIFEMMCQELQVIKQKDIDKDGKLSIIPKDIMKKIIGRSPDYADCMMMRMYYEFYRFSNNVDIFF